MPDPRRPAREAVAKAEGYDWLDPPAAHMPSRPLQPTAITIRQLLDLLKKAKFKKRYCKSVQGLSRAIERNKIKPVGNFGRAKTYSYAVVEALVRIDAN